MEPTGAFDAPMAVPLSDVLARLDVGLVTPVGSVAPTAVMVARIGIYEPGEHASTPGAALIAPGFDASDDAAAGDLAPLVARGASCLFVKSAGISEKVERAADDAGLCLVRVDPRLSWERLFVLASTALTSAERAGALTADAPRQLGDLFALADAIATAVDGNTVIGDAHNRVLAFSNVGHPTDPWRRDTIIGRSPPEHWVSRFRAEGVYEKMQQPGVVVHFELPEEAGFRARRAIGIHAAGRMIGAIAVVEGDRPFHADTDATLVDAAQVAAIHLLRYESHHTLRQHARQDRLRRFLAGEEEPRSAVARLGLPTDEPLVMVAIAPRAPTAASEQQLERLGDFARMRWPGGAVGVQAVFDGRLFLLLGGATMDRRSLAAAITEIIEGGSRLLGTELVAGIGRFVATAEEVTGSREEAEVVVDLLSEVDLGARAATLTDIWPHVALRDLQAVVSDPTSLRRGKALQLVRHDEEHATEYADSLRIYLEELGDVRAAAAQLHVHPNTLRYRVKRAVELADIDLHDPADRLVAEVQLQALRDRAAVPEP